MLGQVEIWQIEQSTMVAMAETPNLSKPKTVEELMASPVCEVGTSNRHMKQGLIEWYARYPA